MAIVLAAGASSRFGSPKAFLAWGDGTLLTRAAEQAHLVAGRVIVIVRPGLGEGLGLGVGLGPAKAPATLVENPETETGMASSIRIGIEHIRDPAVEIALLVAVDQPFVDASHLVALRDAVSPQAPMAAAAYDDIVGIPAAFARALFPRLCSLSGDKGARALLRGGAFGVAHVALPEAAFDIDTRDDLARARARRAALTSS